MVPPFASQPGRFRLLAYRIRYPRCAPARARARLAGEEVWELKRDRPFRAHGELSCQLSAEEARFRLTISIAGVFAQSNSGSRYRDARTRPGSRLRPFVAVPLSLLNGSSCPEAAPGASLAGVSSGPHVPNAARRCREGRGPSTSPQPGARANALTDQEEGHSLNHQQDRAKDHAWNDAEGDEQAEQFPRGLRPVREAAGAALRGRHRQRSHREPAHRARTPCPRPSNLRKPRVLVTLSPHRSATRKCGTGRTPSPAPRARSRGRTMRASELGCSTE